MEYPQRQVIARGNGPIVPARNASGIWTLDGDGLASVEDFEEGPAVVLVRTEHILLLAVELPPIASIARRRAALPFAIEERIAEPLDDVHVALGEAIGDNVYLVGVVRHDLMRQWVDRIERAELVYASIIPDALALPRPGAGSWAVDLAGERVMVRSPDGTGFAAPAALLEQAWQAAGEPACVAYGDPLPPQMHAATLELDAEPLAERLLLPALDLRQGRYAPPRRPISAIWRRIAIVAAAGALAHSAIAVADTIALQNIADQREAEVRLLATTMQPSLVVGEDINAVVAELTPDGPIAAPSLFLPMLSRVGSALGTAQVQVAWRSVQFDNAARSLTVSVEAESAESLLAAEAALSAAGLNAARGAMTTDQGRAVGVYTVTLA